MSKSKLTIGKACAQDIPSLEISFVQGPKRNQTELKKLKRGLPCDTMIPFQGIYLKWNGTVVSHDSPLFNFFKLPPCCFPQRLHHQNIYLSLSHSCWMMVFHVFQEFRCFLLDFFIIPQELKVFHWIPVSSLGMRKKGCMEDQ